MAANDLKMILEDKQKREREDQPKAQASRDLYTSGIVSKQSLNNRALLVQQKDEKVPLLGDSIFLRYLPVPFIKYLYENDEQIFLEIYRRHDYRHPILIWSASMRKTLEEKIKSNAH